MTSFHDILYRRPGQMRASEKETGPNHLNEKAADEVNGMEHESAFPASGHSFTLIGDPSQADMAPPSPLRWTPRRTPQIHRIARNLLGHWALEGNICLTFVGIFPRAGVTTLASLLAQHLASRIGGSRTLLVEMGSDPKRSPTTASHALLHMGDILTDKPWGAPRALTLLTLLPRQTLTPQERTAWLQALIQQARQEFDHIIFDVPPFQQLPEACVVARASDKRVLVLKSGTPQSAVNSLVAELDGLGIPLDGAVLTFREYPFPGWLNGSG